MSFVAISAICLVLAFTVEAFYNRWTGQEIIAKDPSYAPAYAGLADAYALLGSVGSDVAPPNEVMPKAKKAALEAVKLDANLAEGHTSLAYVKLSYDWDLDAAASEFKRAIDLTFRRRTRPRLHTSPAEVGARVVAEARRRRRSTPVIDKDKFWEFIPKSRSKAHMPHPAPAGEDLEPKGGSAQRSRGRNRN